MQKTVEAPGDPGRGALIEAAARARVEVAPGPCAQCVERASSVGRPRRMVLEQPEPATGSPEGGLEGDERTGRTRRSRLPNEDVERPSTAWLHQDGRNPLVQAERARHAVARVPGEALEEEREHLELEP